MGLLVAFDTNEYIAIKKAKMTYTSNEEISKRVGLKYNEFQSYLFRKIMPEIVCKELEHMLGLKEGSLIRK